MIDLVKRLREFPVFVRHLDMATWFQGHGNDPLCAEAADELERLQRELAEARAEIARLQALNDGWARTMDEALNSGDGSYRP